jgi:membrane protease YdiL (CAAX protease family)
VAGVDLVGALITAFEFARAAAPLAAMLLALVLWFRLFAVARWLRAGGQPRHALYFEFVTADVGIAGAVILMHGVEERLGGPPLTQFFTDMRLLGGPDLVTIAGASVALLFVYYVLAVIAGRVAEVVGEMPAPLIAAMRPQTASERFVWVAAVSPAAGFTEEFLFRGLLLWFAFDLGADAPLAIILTSAAFGLGHTAYGFTWAIGTSLLGAASAIAVLWTGSLWPAIIAHTLYDMTVYYILGEQTTADEPQDAAHQPAGFICGLARPR